jgi:Glycosyltransferase family 87
MSRIRATLARLLTIGPGMDGRILVVAAFSIYLAVVAVVRSLSTVDIWPWLGVPTGPSTFFDARNVMAALECRRLGLDPLVENPCDPWGRPIVYPRPWLALRFLGLDQSDTTFFAVAAIALFVVAYLWSLERITNGEGIVAALAVCSPAVMLAVERANMDLVMFALLVLAVAAWGGGDRLRSILSPTLVLAAGVAKVYPVFGLGAFLATRERRAMLTAIACGAGFAAWAVLTADDLVAVADRAPQGEYYSYGARILLSRGFRVLAPEGWEGSALVTQAVAALTVIPLGIVAWFWVRRRILVVDERIDRKGLAFFIGSLVYLGTFLIGNNFDYRLVFVLLTLPQLFAWTRGDDPRSQLASITLVSILSQLWLGALSPYVATLDEVISWATAVLLFSCLTASLPSPGEMLGYVARPGRRIAGARVR